MVNLEPYFQRLQDVIGSAKSADEIKEVPWLEVVKVLSDTAIGCAQELQKEDEKKGLVYFKPSRDCKPAYILGHDKAPPTRLLALDLILSYWIGWISQTHGLSDAMNMSLKAYSEGKMAFDEYKKAEDEKKATEKEGKAEDEKKSTAKEVNAKTSDSNEKHQTNRHD